MSLIDERKRESRGRNEATFVVTNGCAKLLQENDEDGQNRKQWRKDANTTPGGGVVGSQTRKREDAANNTRGNTPRWCAFL